MWFCKNEKYVLDTKSVSACEICGGVFQADRLTTVVRYSNYQQYSYACASCAKPYQEKKERRRLIIKYIENNAEEEERLYQKAVKFNEESWSLILNPMKRKKSSSIKKRSSLIRS